MGLEEELALEASEVDTLPSDSELRDLRDMAAELVLTENEIKLAEAKLKELKKRRYELQNNLVPSRMDELGVDIVGVPGLSADVVSKFYCKANIAADWEEDRRERAFKYLESIGAGDIVRTEVKMYFGPGDDNVLKALLDMIESSEIPFPLVEQRKAVPWNTLTAFAKERIESGEPLDLEAIGATAGTVAQVKKRKD